MIFYIDGEWRVVTVDSHLPCKPVDGSTVCAIRAALHSVVITRFTLRNADVLHFPSKGNENFGKEIKGVFLVRFSNKVSQFSTFKVCSQTGRNG